MLTCPLCHAELPQEDVLDALEQHLPECPRARGERHLPASLDHRHVADVDLREPPPE